MGRNRKYTSEQLVQVTQKYFESDYFAKASFIQLAKWANEQGFAIGEQIFRRDPKVQKLMEDQKNQGRKCSKTIPVEGSFEPFDVRAEVMKLNSEYSTQRLIGRLQEREMYFKNMYKNNVTLANLCKEHIQKISELSEHNQQLGKQVLELKDKLREIKQKSKRTVELNRRLKELLETSIYPEYALAELDEIGLHVERSKLTNDLIDEHISDGYDQTHEEMCGKVIDFMSGQGKKKFTFEDVGDNEDSLAQLMMSNLGLD